MWQFKRQGKRLREKKTHENNKTIFLSILRLILIFGYKNKMGSSSV